MHGVATYWNPWRAQEAGPCAIGTDGDNPILPNSNGFHQYILLILAQAAV